MRSARATIKDRVDELNAEQGSRSSTFRVAYVPAYLPSYETLQHDVISRSASTLRQRVQETGGTLVEMSEPIISAQDAERAATT